MSENRIPLLSLPQLLAGPISAYQALGWDGNVAAAGAAIAGVAECDGVAGDMVPATVLGTATMISGGAVAKGAQVEVGANGRVITHNTGIVVGRAMEAATAAGQLFEVLPILG